MTRSLVLAGAFAASLLASVSAANAHDAAEVVHELRAKGYHHIRVIDPYLPKIQINACKDGNRWHLHANNYGDITHREWAGPCFGSGYRTWRRGYRDYSDY